MSEHIKNVVVKLCSQYQNPGNSTIRSILMLWLNLFGNIYSNSNYYKFISESKEVLSVYEEMK